SHFDGSHRLRQTRLVGLPRVTSREMWLVSFLRNHIFEETIRIFRKLTYCLGVISLAVKPEMTISADTYLSVDQAMKAFRPCISAELLKSQFRWLVAESKSQHLKKPKILRRVLTAWVNNHPEERFTKPQ